MGKKRGQEGKNRVKEVKNQEKRDKIVKKEAKSGRKVKNRKGSFTLPLLTERADYATDIIPKLTDDRLQ